MSGKRILVIGASRGIGLATVKAACAKGWAVTAFSRHASELDYSHQNLTKTDGDALIADDLAPALHDQDAVVLSLGVPFNLQLFTGPITLFSSATDVVLEQMQQQQVKRLVCVTGFGAGDSIDAIHPLQRLGFNLVFGRAYADKSLQEAAIKSSQLAWTIVRPGVLTNGEQKAYKILVDADSWRNGIISRANVADFVVDALDRESHIGEAPVLIN
ncbi:MAG: SDR family NAD(P)-dependent oxidoreductase [Pseudomonadaceae bacterium]|nr:SDR family NAD(P)-dependent oxidoreductase [Pseudomonadaceae bacterium]